MFKLISVQLNQQLKQFHSKVCISTKMSTYIDDPIIKISTGTLKGAARTSYKLQKFYSFQGIPYAKPPIGDLRFKAPQPAEPWEGVREAKEESEQCMQHDMVLNKLVGSEDCLYLNVYTRRLTQDATPETAGVKLTTAKPVMVWIHGGAFTTGSNKTHIYGPEYLMSEDIVLVTINYRLHIFGFLQFEDESLGIPGNAGMKDMVMALKWVQTNICYFNGNPNNVTIFGESAGGAAVHYLILSPLGKGLFSKAIMQSGCVLNSWACGKNNTEELVQALHLPNESERDVYEALMQLESKDVFELTTKVEDDFLACNRRPWGPLMEKEGPDAFYVGEPEERLVDGTYNAVPIMWGYTTREGMLTEMFAKQNPEKYAVLDFEECIPFPLNVVDPGDVARKIKEFYYKDEEPSDDNKDIHYLLDTDNLFVREILRCVDYHINSSNKQVFVYRMSLETKINFLKTLLKIKAPGVCHGDELGYLFKNALLPPIEPGTEEERGMRRFVKLWTNFAKYGIPITNRKDELLNIDWEAYNTLDSNFMDIGNDLTALTNPEKQRMLFWRRLFEENSE